MVCLWIWEGIKNLCVTWYLSLTFWQYANFALKTDALSFPELLFVFPTICFIWRNLRQWITKTNIHIIHMHMGIRIWAKNVHSNKCLSCTIDAIISKSFRTNFTFIYYIFKLRSGRPKRNSSRAKFYRTAKTWLGCRQQTAEGVSYLTSSKTADYFTRGSCSLLNYNLKQMNRGHCKTQCLDYLILVFPCNSTGRGKKLEFPACPWDK